MACTPPSQRSFLTVFFAVILALVFLLTIALGSEWILSQEGLLIILIVSIVGLILYQALLAEGFSLSLDSYEKDRRLGFVEKQMLLSANVYKSMGDGVVVTTTDGVIVDINPAMENMTLFSRDEVVGQRPNVFQSGFQNDAFYESMWENINKIGRWSGDIKNKKKNGDIYIQNTVVEAILNDAGEAEYYVAVCRDVSEERRIESRLSEIAYYDDLTGLANKRLFGEKLDTALCANEGGQKIAVLVIDLDGLYLVNEQYGHQVGDFVIKSIGARIERFFDEHAIVSRFGGDEFCVATPVETIERLDSLISGMLVAVSLPLSIPGVFSHGDGTSSTVCATSSVGVTIFPGDNVSADTLVRHAGHAMHTAKTKGGNQYCMFSIEDDKLAHRHHEIIRAIDLAMQAEEIVPFYQPKIDIVTRKVVGAEALTRWISNGKPIPPAEFIGNIERCSDSLPTRFTLHMADIVARDIKKWMSLGVYVPISINVFPSNLQDPDFHSGLESIVCKHGIPYHMIELEILESSDVGDRSVASQSMLKLRDMGFKLSIDDFGTGYSSLDYLRKLPIETLKIDQSFVISMPTNPEDEKIVNAVIQLAKSLNFSVVAEGIESEETAEMLSKMGCVIGQGYLYSKPIPEHLFLDWVKENS